MTTSPGARANLHATGLVLGGIGVLLRGPSGAGKSLLALELIDRESQRGSTGLLVSDDRIDLELTDGRLVMHAPQAIVGLIELRGRGIVTRPHAVTAPLHLVVDLVDELVRMVEEAELTTDLLDAAVPRCPVPRRGVVDSAHQLLLVDEALRALKPPVRQRRQKTT